MARIISQLPVIDIESDVAIGIKLPLNNPTRGVFDLSYSTEEQAISNLKNLLLTSKGERLYLPTFGTDILTLLFDPNTPEIVESLKEEITSAIGFWMPYIIVNNIDIQNKVNSLGSNAENGLSISINYRVSSRGANQTIVLDINQSGIINVQ
jgi:phage baseplate assembly protein W